MNKPFQFKQFTVHQDRCAMKIGTDGVLLGAWISVDNDVKSILDIGAGTGIIALQMAQRSNAQTIDAVEIDENAYEQCVENFENSTWGDRLFCYHASFQEFVMEMDDEKYDLVVSNPPFYAENYKTANKARDVARFTDALPFEHLITGVHQLLSENGTFATILPRKEESKFIKLANASGLFPKRICRVKGNVASEEKRSLIEFTFRDIEINMEQLSIEITRHNYTDAYVDLVSDFYLDHNKNE